MEKMVRPLVGVNWASGNTAIGEPPVDPLIAPHLDPMARVRVSEQKIDSDECFAC